MNSELIQASKICSNPACKREFPYYKPSAPGKYNVACPFCNQQNEIEVTADSKEPAETPGAPQPKQELTLGMQEDGSYRFRCKKCNAAVRVPDKLLRPGLNKVKCPKCQAPNEFTKPFTEEELLQCSEAGCQGHIIRPSQSGDGVYSSECDICHAKYSIVMHEGKVNKVSRKTDAAPKTETLDNSWEVGPTESMMRLVTGSFFNKRYYDLSRGTHYVGRHDQFEPSNFQLHDDTASRRSLRIDVLQVGDGITYKMTVQRAFNPVFHNNRELRQGDIVYLYYGDRIKVGQTIIKVEKSCK